MDKKRIPRLLFQRNENLLLSIDMSNKFATKEESKAAFQKRCNINHMRSLLEYRNTFFHSLYLVLVEEKSKL